MQRSREEMFGERKIREVKQECSCLELKVVADHRNDHTNDRGLVMQCRKCGKLHE